MYASQNFSVLGLGENGSFNVYERSENETYELALSYSVGEPIAEIEAD